MYPRVGEKRRIDDLNLEDEEAIGSLCRLSGRPVSPKTAMEQEKRMRRMIANSNERRRMQSINAGFNSLKLLLPHQEGEKLSKAAILQQTADYIYNLEQEKTRLLSQYCQMKRLLNQQHHSDNEGSPSGSDSPCDDRSLNSSPNELSTVGTTVPHSTAPVSDSAAEELRKEVRETKTLLEREKRARKKLEEHIKILESKIYSERKEITCYQTRPKEVVEVTEVKDEVTSPSDSPPLLQEEIKVESLEHEDIKLQEVILPLNAKTANNSSRTTTAGFSSNARTANGQSFISPNTIVTVVPSKALNKSLSPVLEIRRANEVETSHDSESLLIVNSNNSCQNSPLDTICEAIRHLEGDNMFAPEEHHPRIEEEVITEETYTIEEDSHQSLPQNLHHSSVSGYQTSPGNSSIYASHVNHPLGGAMGHLTLQMIHPEPQEVPLELTTNRTSSSGSNETSNNSSSTTTSTHYVKEVNFIQSPQNLSSQNSSLLRPGVIVVKQH